MLERRLVKRGCACEYPQIIGTLAAHKYPLVVVIDGEDVVVGVEKEEE